MGNARMAGAAMAARNDSGEASPLVECPLEQRAIGVAEPHEGALEARLQAREGTAHRMGASGSWRLSQYFASVGTSVRDRM